MAGDSTTGYQGHRDHRRPQRCQGFPAHHIHTYTVRRLRTGKDGLRLLCRDGGQGLYHLPQDGGQRTRCARDFLLLQEQVCQTVPNRHLGQEQRLAATGCRRGARTCRRGCHTGTFPLARRTEFQLRSHAVYLHAQLHRTGGCGTNQYRGGHLAYLGMHGFGQRLVVCAGGIPEQLPRGVPCLCRHLLQG